MSSLLTTTDLVVFIGSLVAVMAVGLWFGRKEEDSADFYLAGRKTRWWGVAGSIFGSNVSANHIVGMMGVGFSVGFAQSHFEITAIAGLLLLCYGFLPVYRKLNVYTLSEYLSRRYDDSSRVAYALIMIIIMVIIQMVPGFYIGSRSINQLLFDYGDTAAATPQLAENGKLTGIAILNAGEGYTAEPEIKIPPPMAAEGQTAETPQAKATLREGCLQTVQVSSGGSKYEPDAPPAVEIIPHKESKAPKQPASVIAVVAAKGKQKGQVTSLRIIDGGEGYPVDKPPTVRIAPPVEGETAIAIAAVSQKGVARIDLQPTDATYDAEKPPRIRVVGGASFNTQYSPGDVNPTYYVWGILIMAVVTGGYVIFGGLKAVIFTDVLQSILMLVGGLLVAFYAYSAIGGWDAVVALDRGQSGVDRLHLYNPIDDPQLPWTGVLTGLMVLHFYYWGTNQFIVQRALSARSDREARLGIITAGFFKLLIPFFSIGVGIAAFYLFRQQGTVVDQDAVFVRLITDLFPIGVGLIGLVAAGVIGAILSSIDSMMNSAATIFTFDIYKRFGRPEASEKELILVGRICIAAFLLLAVTLTIFTSDPNSESSFFLTIAAHQSRLIAGVVVAFGLGMLWKGATGAGAFVAIVSGVAFSYGLPVLYEQHLGTNESVAAIFGKKLNFFHAVFIAAVLSAVLHVLVSKLTRTTAEKSRHTWTELGGHDPTVIRRFGLLTLLSLAIYALLAVAMVLGLSPHVCGLFAALWTMGAFVSSIDARLSPRTIFSDDRFWAGLLAALAIFMMYEFY